MLPSDELDYEYYDKLLEESYNAKMDVMYSPDYYYGENDDD